MRLRAEPAAEALALSAFMAFIAIFSLRLHADIDVFWHVVAGRLLVERGLDVGTDTFSAIDPGRPWIPLVWAYEVLVYGLDRLGGLQALRLFHAAIQWLAFLLFYLACRRRLGYGPLASLAWLALLVVLYADRFRARPHVFNLLFEVLLLPVLVGGAAALVRPGARAPKAAPTLALAVLFGLWANLHAGGAFLLFVALGAIPAAAIAEAWLSGERVASRARALVLACLMVLGPALVSPFFIRGIVHTFGMVEAAEAYTTEWHPTWRLLWVGKIPGRIFAGLFPTFVAVAFALVTARFLRILLRTPKIERPALFQRFPLHALFLAVALLYLSHRSVRFVYMAAFALLVLAPLLRASFPGLSLEPRSRRSALAASIVLFAFMAYQSRIALLYGTLPNALRTVTGATTLERGRFPVAQADFLARTNFGGTIFCGPSWGGYLLYRLWPPVRVLTDGRGNHELAVTEDVRIIQNRENMRDRENGPAIAAIYEKYSTGAVVGPHPVWPDGYRPPPWWVRVQADETGAVWIDARREEPYLQGLARLGLVRTSSAPP